MVGLERKTALSCGHRQLYLTDITRFYGDVLDKKGIEFSELSVSTCKEKLTDILLTILLVKFIIIISVLNQSIVIGRQNVYHPKGFHQNRMTYGFL